MLLVLQRGQPALLYLVPCILIPTCASAKLQNEFLLLWHGVPPKKTDLPTHNSEGQEMEDPLLEEKSTSV